MPYLTLDHVRAALIYMRDHTHPSLMSLLAMLREGVPASDSDDDAISFGSAVERRLMSDYFRPPGGPDDRPFFVPFGSGRGVSHWRDNNYAGRSLQRQRQDKGTVFRQHSSDNRRWTLAADFIEAIKKESKDIIGDLPVEAAYIAAWCFRDKEIESLERMVSDFETEFRLRDFGLVGPIISTDIPDDLSKLPLAASPIDEAELLELLQSLEPEKPDETDRPEEDAAEAPPARVFRPLEAPGSWDASLADLGDLCGLQGLEEPATRALAALSAGVHVILTGPPGTGKTQLAECLCLKAGFPSWTVPATDQWTTFETIGGYFPTPQDEDGGADRLDFLPGAVVDSLEKGRCLIIDEINRADIDKAFGELFTLLSGNTVTLPYRRRTKDGHFRRVRLQVGPAIVADEEAEVIPIPPWWRIIGSMNDADKASLKRLSMAFVRRFAFVPIDLPGRPVFERIISGAAEQTATGRAGKGDMNALTTTLVNLFADADSGFAGIGLPLGPAFPKAIIHHADSEWRLDPGRGHEPILVSALELYVMPQFQGRPELHEDCLNLLQPLLPTLRDDFARHLAVWTGFVP